MTKEFTDTETKKFIDELLEKTNHQTAANWASDCAERVLSYYEQQRPQDERLKRAIEASRRWARGEIRVGDARKAAFPAHAAAREAIGEAAIAAARAAGQASSTPHMIGHAIHASTYAVKAVAFETNFEEAAIAEERNWQYERLKELVRP
ncbi:putative immunity protein [Planococcus sp. 1R117A]|uniref:putative immunity protein n=1 Tax=Planococcus sp. 1R117A TaxID=3447020 RepID=UPI003EDC8A98